jgi:23S rRNA (cytidine1920-2'-O)/16S rRNA (cytidine1409-2'-O)-methyltransferase
MTAAKRKSKKKRLDELLVDLGFFGDASKALGPIMSGDVRVAGVPVTKAGEQVAPDAEIVVKGQELQFASRGGYKLERALERFGIDVTGKVVLDAGASTGGFTDCLLQRGASTVYAVDVGYGQLRGKLAADSRVVVMEKTNISDLILDRPLPSAVDLCAADLSYLSLAKAIPILREIMGDVPLITLVKPLYEGLEEESKDDKEEILSVVEHLIEDLMAAGETLPEICVSPILGGRGAVECLLLSDPSRQGKSAPALIAQLDEDWQGYLPS